MRPKKIVRILTVFLKKVKSKKLITHDNHKKESIINSKAPQKIMNQNGQPSYAA
jgi:hypothetical protein